MSVFTVAAQCVGCGACIATCPERAFRAVRPVDGGAPLIVLADRCTGCGECAEICPVDACVEAASVGPVDADSDAAPRPAEAVAS